MISAASVCFFPVAVIHMGNIYDEMYHTKVVFQLETFKSMNCISYGLIASPASNGVLMVICYNFVLLIFPQKVFT